MAKINLLTIHWGKCYGAVMQTYATCRLLEEAGHDVNVINLIHPKVRKYYQSPKHWVYFVLEFQFWLFKKRFFSRLTNKGYSIKDITLPKADITVVGSDQVWNYDITSFFGHTFYLDYVPDNQKRVAFCSSFGRKATNYPSEYKEKVRECFKKFSALSVRESSGVDILKNDFGLNSVHLIDPTLLWGQFDEIASSNKREYTLYRFLLNDSPNAIMLSEFISKEVGCPIFRETLFSRLFGSGPIKWLNHIKNSRYVITDSFHGLAMSIIFHKDFFVFCADPQKFTRLESLLHLVNLEGRFIKSEEDFLSKKNQLMKPIDYVSIDRIIGLERVKCSHFINEQLG